jgi:hypothetical protein
MEDSNFASYIYLSLLALSYKNIPKVSPLSIVDAPAVSNSFPDLSSV